MTPRERFRAVLDFEPVDRLPIIEWAGWWDQTIARWHNDGLPPDLTDAFEIRAYLGLDPVRQCWICAVGSGAPGPKSHGSGIIENEAGYEAILQDLYPDPPQFDTEQVRQWGQLQATGELVVWLSLEGFFWYPRRLLGIQRHLLAFHDQPRLMHRICADLARYNAKCIETFCDLCTPDFMTFAEDMSYNHGPMCSRAHFEEFMAPHYRQLVPMLRERGVTVFVDTDGDVTPLVPWLLDVGVEGLLPLERMAGVDVNKLRRDHPSLRMIGAFDKTVMHLGSARIREEFERLLPVMRSGGFVPSVDHQTPPDVSLEDYRTYLELLAEYAVKGAPGGAG